MIRLNRPRAPAALAERGSALTARDLARHAAEPDAFREGRRRFTFRANVYGHASVKALLFSHQHGKCAFCESKIGGISSGDVEHFRPKAGVRQEDRGPLELPGYFWLAYTWENLFLACELCNRRFKRNLFPLIEPARRVRRPGHDCAEEEPLLVDPAAEEPAEHLSFDGWSVVALSAKGAATIAVLGLGRPLLDEDRRRHFRLLSSLRDLIEVADAQMAEADEARKLLSEACLPASPWSAMALQLLRDRPLPPVSS